MQSRSLLFALFVVPFLTYGYFFHSGQHNENARYNHIRALAEDGKNSINPYVHNTADVIVVDKNTYSNKPPGSVYLGIPAWVASRTVLNLFGVEEERAEHYACYFTVWLTVGVLAAVLGVLLFILLEYQLKSSYLALIVVLAYQLGTLAFPYSVMFFSHQLVAALLFFSFFLVFFAKESARGVKFSSTLGKKFQQYHWHYPVFLFVSGCFAAYSVVVEYLAGMGMGMISLYVLFTARNFRSIFWYVGGLFIGVLPLFIFNLIVFDSLFFTTYGVDGDDSNPFHSLHSKGFMGFTMPSLDILYRLTFQPYRGLFYCNPWLTFLVPAFLVPIFDRKYWKERLMALGIVVSFIVFNSGYKYWFGGANIGPRFIVAMLPFAALLIAPILKIGVMRLLFYPLALCSAGIMLIVTATNPRPGFEYSNPIFALNWPNYIKSNFTKYDLGVFNHTLLTEDSIGFNWGQLIGLPEPYQLLPLIALWILFIVSIPRLLKSRTSELEEESIDGDLASKMELKEPRLFIFCSTLPLILLAFVPLGYSYQQSRKGPVLNGLSATYLEGVVWSERNPPKSSEPIVKNAKILEAKIDRKVFFRWEGGPPFPNSFSAIWRGQITLEKDGLYRFATESDDGSMIFLNGAPIVNNWGTHGTERVQSELMLKKGVHTIEIIYFNSLFGAALKVYWQPPNEGWHAIPEDVLKPLSIDLEE